MESAYNIQQRNCHPEKSLHWLRSTVSDRDVCIKVTIDDVDHKYLYDLTTTTLLIKPKLRKCSFMDPNDQLRLFGLQTHPSFVNQHLTFIKSTIQYGLRLNGLIEY